MKHVLREIGAALIMLAALALNAQTLVGRPQYGVTLGGTAREPAIQNMSGKTVIGHVLIPCTAPDPSPLYKPCQAFAALKSTDIGLDMIKGLAQGQSETPLAGFAKAGAVLITQQQQLREWTTATLDLVAFEDGGVAGPDATFSFDVWQQKLSDQQQLAAYVFAARHDPAKHAIVWDELTRIRTSVMGGHAPLSDHNKFTLAAGMLFRHVHPSEQAKYLHVTVGDEEVFNVADRIMAMKPLWRMK